MGGRLAWPARRRRGPALIIPCMGQGIQTGCCLEPSSCSLLLSYHVVGKGGSPIGHLSPILHSTDQVCLQCQDQRPFMILSASFEGKVYCVVQQEGCKAEIRGAV